MKIRLAGFKQDSIVDGPGIRFTIFTQGCKQKCEDCHNPQTHDFNGGKLYNTDDILEKIRSNPLLDGVTLSGGEPFEQAEALNELLDKLNGEYNIYCFTGYNFEYLLKQDKNIKELLNKIDVLVDGPFMKDKRSLELKFKGSSNQRLLNCKESVRVGKAIEIDI